MTIKNDLRKRRTKERLRLRQNLEVVAFNQEMIIDQEVVVMASEVAAVTDTEAVVADIWAKGSSIKDENN